MHSTTASVWGEFKIPMKKIVSSENGMAEDITFYQDSRAHLSDELRMLDIVLRLEMMRQRKNRPSGQHEPYKGLVLFDDDMAAMLENKENPFARGDAHGDSDPLATALSDELDEYESQIRERCAANLCAGRY
jgi:hypothetical protein